MQWFQYRSGASRETVEGWFRPGYSLLGDTLRRGLGITAGYAIIGYGVTRLWYPHLNGAWYDLQPAILGYSIAIAWVFSFVCAGALFLFCAGHMAELNVLWFMRTSSYNYVMAKSSCRYWSFYDDPWHSRTRFLGVCMLMIAFVAASGLVSKHP